MGSLCFKIVKIGNLEGTSYIFLNLNHVLTYLTYLLTDKYIFKIALLANNERIECASTHVGNWA